MPKFLCSYAHDIACFEDFVVEAKSQRAALRQIRAALREGRFENLNPEPAWENEATHQRVFVLGLASEHSTNTTLEQLVGPGSARNKPSTPRKESTCLNS